MPKRHIKTPTKGYHLSEEGIRQMDKCQMSEYQSIMEELALARMLIRELGDRLAKLESKE